MHLDRELLRGDKQHLIHEAVGVDSREREKPAPARPDAGCKEGREEAYLGVRRCLEAMLQITDGVMSLLDTGILVLDQSAYVRRQRGSQSLPVSLYGCVLTRFRLVDNRPVFVSGECFLQVDPPAVERSRNVTALRRISS